MIAIDGFVVLLLLVGAGALGVRALGRRHRDAVLARVPPTMTAGSLAEASHAVAQFRADQRMARELDRLLTQDSVLPFLSSEQRTRIEIVLREWEDQ